MKKTTTPELDAMSMRPSHTPTAFYVVRLKAVGNLPEAFEVENEVQSICRAWSEKHAAYIVKCVNAHEALVQAAQMARYYVEKLWNETKGSDREGTAMGCAGALDALDKVLAKADGK